MRPIVVTDNSEWSRQLRAIVKATGMDAKTVVTQRGRAALGYIMDFTPPKNRAQGRAAVKRDITSTMRPVRAQEIDSPKLKRIVQRRDITAFNAAAAHFKHGPLKDHVAVPFSPDVHERARDRRGRVRREYKQVVLGAGEAAKWGRYLKLVQTRVGWARRGWLPSLLALGGKAPAWVTNAGGASKAGAIIDNRGHPTNPEVTVINHTAWASNNDEGKRVVGNALRIHSNIMRRDIRRIVKANADRQKVPLVRWT